MTLIHLFSDEPVFNIWIKINFFGSHNVIKLSTICPDIMLQKSLMSCAATPQKFNNINELIYK